MMTPKLRTWHEFSGGKQLEEKVYDKYGIKVVHAGNTKHANEWLA